MSSTVWPLLVANHSYHTHTLRVNEMGIITLSNQKRLKRAKNELTVNWCQEGCLAIMMLI